MVMQVWELDEFGRSVLAGYGFAHLPTNAGERRLLHNHYLHPFI